MPQTLSQAEIEAIRTTLEMQMFQTATIQRKTLTPDGMGGNTESLTTVGTSVCRLSTADKRLGLSLIGQLVGDRIENRDQYTIYFPHVTDVRADDLVSVDGRTFRVTSVLYGDWEFTRRAAVMPA